MKVMVRVREENYYVMELDDMLVEVAYQEVEEPESSTICKKLLRNKIIEERTKNGASRCNPLNLFIPDSCDSIFIG